MHFFQKVIYPSKDNYERRVNNNAYAADDEITLINNAMIYLFSGVKYELGCTTIETINYPGQTTSMIGYLTYPDDFSTSPGLSLCSSKDTNDSANSARYAVSAAVPAAGYIPEDNPTCNQGFATRKVLYLAQLLWDVSSSTSH